MNEQEYREIDPIYDQLKREVPLMPRITVHEAQRQYRFGYNRAARTLEQLAEVGVLAWNKVTGVYRRAPTATSEHD